MAAPFILVSPFGGWLISVFLDIIDYPIGVVGGVTFSNYQLIDKSIDVWFRVFMVITPFIMGWSEAWIFLLFFLYRLIGDLFLYFSRDYADNQWLLIVFPNFLDIFFPLYFVYAITSLPIGNPSLLLGIVLFTVAAKLLNEYTLHIIKFRNPIYKKLLKFNPNHHRPKNG